MATELDIHVVEDDKYSVMAACQLIVMASGTAALETALLGVPAVVIYRTSWITAAIARAVMKVDYISLPNIILGEEVYPELLQHQCSPERILREALDILEDSSRYGRIQTLIKDVVEHLGKPGAAGRAAHYLVEFLELK
jgi:lipid-A-disaccharide synthase